MTHPFAHLLTVTGAYDRAAILRDAARMAKQQSSRAPLPGFARQTYREAFGANLKMIWACAKAARAAFALPAAEMAERASIAFGAAMIDCTAASYAAQGARRSIWGTI